MQGHFKDSLAFAGAENPAAADTPSTDSKPANPPSLPRFLFQWIAAHRWRVAIGTVLLIAMEFWLWGLGKNDVLDAAYAIPDGGGYCALTDTGVNQTIRQGDSLILSASKGGTYCCGYTFEVAMTVARKRGLLAKTPATKVRRFQQEWYGAEKGSEQKQCALAVVNLGIGREIPMAEAKPGDFVAFQRLSGIGHSVVFLGWIKDRDGEITGIRFRSSQPTTNGVADACEFIADPDAGSTRNFLIDRNHIYVARLNRQWWSSALYPFDL